MLFPPDVANHVVNAVYWADRQIRADHAQGLIAGEDDYTSNLTHAIRRQINARTIPGLSATSFVLNAGKERETGADACIILSNKTEEKVCLFEAKWPRLSTRRNVWDYEQVSSGASHFSDQLQRQAQFVPPFAIWEMFYTNLPIHERQPGFPGTGSACVWFNVAQARSDSRPDQKAPWSDAELIELLGHSKKPLQIGNCVREVCECRVGSLLTAGESTRRFQDPALGALRTLRISYEPA